MKYVRISKEEAAEAIAGAVNHALSEGTVLLLVSGGSNIDLAVSVRKKIQQPKRLTVGLVDERYGPAGHADSNWAQLINAGFNTEDLTIIPVLQNLPIEQTATDYSDSLADAIGNNDRVIGIFGIGQDGHTSGILPGSPAVESRDLVTSYQGADFQRVTTTPLLFKDVGEAFLVAYGEGKRQVLEQLADEIPITQQPAQLLKQAKRLTVFNDQIGSE